ncbi:MAG: hypothetical protein ABIJ48_06255 [Actinomycetota bacterium]
MRATRRRSWGTTVLVMVICGVMLAAGGLASPAVGTTGRAVMCLGREATLVGTNPAGETLHGTAGDDVIVGLGGNDIIIGYGGNDRICGGGGNDTISPGPGNDRVRGGPGADILRGGGGADVMRGDAGPDRLFGGAGNDRLDGGLGIDTCASGETLSGCEVVPPAGCSPNPVVPATAETTNVVVTGSNARQWTDSYTYIDGTSSRLTVEAEVRNNTGDAVRLGKAKIEVYNAAGARIGVRYAYPSADVLAPRERTVVGDTWPSMFYSPGETNSFPAGWASWKLILDATTMTGEPAVHDGLVTGSRLLSLAENPDGKLAYRMAVINTLDRPIDGVSQWLVLYDSHGALIRIQWVIGNLEGTLAPGAEVRFEGTLGTYGVAALCFTSARSGAATYVPYG